MKLYKTVILVFLSFILVKCKKHTNSDVKVEKQLHTLSNNYTFETNNYCSSNLLFDEHVFGNTILSITPNKNFLKCTAISDNEFVFSCGRGKKEVTLFKVSCGSYKMLGFDGVTLPKIEYNDEDLLILYLKAGSDSWTNYFVYISENKVYAEQALYIDYENRKYVYLDAHDYQNGNIYFVVHDIMSDRRDRVRSNYHKFRTDGFPALYISNVKLANNKLSYAIEVADGVIGDTILVPVRK